MIHFTRLLPLPIFLTITVVLIGLSIAGIFQSKKINRELFIPACGALGCFGISATALKLADTFAPDSFVAEILLWIDMACLVAFLVVLFVTMQLAVKRGFIPQDKVWLVKQANVAFLLLIPIVLFVAIMLII
jgi:hypothetical protein